MTNPGSWILFPAALRFACQIFFMARPPSWMASEEPVVAVPIACFADGACHTSARIEMPWHTKLVYLVLWRIETYNACGWSLARSSERVIQIRYWELTRSGVFIRIFRRELDECLFPFNNVRDEPIKFFVIFSWTSLSAWGGIQVWTKDAKLRTVDPSEEIRWRSPSDN